LPKKHRFLKLLLFLSDVQVQMQNFYSTFSSKNFLTSVLQIYFVKIDNEQMMKSDNSEHCDEKKIKNQDMEHTMMTFLFTNNVCLY